MTFSTVASLTNSSREMPRSAGVAMFISQTSFFMALATSAATVSDRSSMPKQRAMRRISWSHSLRVKYSATGAVHAQQ